jgi:glucokinase
MSQYLLGFDLGGTKLMAALVGRDFRVVKRFRQKTKAGQGDQEAVYQRIVETIRQVLDSAGVRPEELGGIGVGSPGPLELPAGLIVDTPNIGFKNFPLGARLAEDFQRPVFVDNDVNLGAYGEYHFGAGQGARHLVGVFPGTGIGGGLILDGRIYHGASGAAGEIGHVTMDPHGPLCGCGQLGCVEAYAGRNIIAAQLAVLAQRGQAPHLLAQAGTNLRNIRSAAMQRAIAAGDHLVEQTVRGAAARLGVACAGLVNLLSPDAIVLGGGLVEAMPQLFLEEVERALDDFSLPYLRKFCQVKVAELGDDATVLGAARLAADHVGEPDPA